MNKRNLQAVLLVVVALIVAACREAAPSLSPEAATEAPSAPTAQPTAIAPNATPFKAVPLSTAAPATKVGQILPEGCVANTHKFEETYVTLKDGTKAPLFKLLDVIYREDIQGVHIDYFTPGNPSVSVIIGPEDPNNPRQLGRHDNRVQLEGFGFDWELPVEGCESVDLNLLAKDAERYQNERRALPGGESLASGGVISLDDWLNADWSKPSTIKWIVKPQMPESEWIRLAPRVTAAPSFVKTSAVKAQDLVATSSTCSATQNGVSDKMSKVSATNTTLSVEAWGGDVGNNAFVIVPSGETVSRSWTGGAIWDYKCLNTQAAIADVSGRNRPVYVVNDGKLVSQGQ